MQRGIESYCRISHIWLTNKQVFTRNSPHLTDRLSSIFFMQAWHRVRTAGDLTNLLALGSVGSFLKIKYKRGRSTFLWSGRLTDGK